MDKSSKFFMGGTDGSGEYVVIALGERGRVGVRRLADTKYRIRLEPVDFDGDLHEEIADYLEGEWNRPEDSDHHRFSICSENKEQTLAFLSMALKGIGDIEEVNPEAPEAFKALISTPFKMPTAMDKKLKEATEKADAIIALAQSLAAMLNDLRK